MIERSREADAFVATISQTGPEAVSACDGWTTHEIAAHVTGIAVEVNPSSRPVPARRSGATDAKLRRTRGAAAGDRAPGAC